MSVQLVSTQQQELGWSSGLLNSSQAKRKLPECVQVCVSGSWVKEQRNSCALASFHTDNVGLICIQIYPLRLYHTKASMSDHESRLLLSLQEDRY